ncbi:heterokaryon incompatibility protein-domain-containing protein [Chaetomium sp. MPI-CAGE-AT-0009]|nr:heterokaryon incompatibility protein-domain-containing protein [Chaetomium sp. MPI-CAGE-AT-0009]
MYSATLDGTCQRIFDSPESLPLATQKDAEHHHTLAQLQDSADRRCFICSALWDDILCRRRPTEMESCADSNEDDAARHPVSVYRMRNVYQSPELLELAILSKVLGLAADLSTEIRHGGQDLPAVSTTHSLFSMAVAQEWLKNCIENHERCRAISLGTTRQPPTRLLEIDRPGSGEIRLVETTAALGAHVKYATLSHCWGQSRVLRLTSGSKQRLQAGIPISDLGLTFRDAVSVARSLGVRYIWIDSLCIIQDSKEDWLHEAPRMVDVYGAALFNIAATSGADTDAGCHPLREGRRLFEPLIVTLKGTGFPDGRYLLYDYRYKDNAFKDMPLLRRGWVVQELLLASRVLHFCRAEMFWECLPPKMRDPWIPRELAWKALRSFPGHPEHAVTNGNGVTLSDLLWDLWPKLVGYYSLCSLTYASDKLAALSGIAKVIQQVFKMDYRAGLWDHELEDQLLWVGLGDPTLEPRYPPPTYRAPTWSWASMDGPIGLSWHRKEGERWRRVVTIQDCHIEAQTEDSTIGIVNGFLRLSGWLITIRLRKDPAGERRWDVFANGVWRETGGTCRCIYLDGQVPTGQIHALAVVVLVDTRDNQPAMTYFLLLHATGDTKGWFYRVGIMFASLESLGVAGRDYTALLKFRNESWLEYETRDDAGLSTIVVV